MFQESVRRAKEGSAGIRRLCTYREPKRGDEHQKGVYGDP